jgi:tRNA A37 threonylcarbamoyltransferase TsaD
MSDRETILNFIETAAAQMARLARRDGVSPRVAAEMTQIALELATEADHLEIEIQLDNLSANVANSNRPGLTGLSD